MLSALSLSPPGANILVGDLGPIALGKARRTGTVAGSVDGEEAAAAAGAFADSTVASAGGAGEGAAAPALAFRGVDSGACGGGRGLGYAWGA